MVTSSLIMKRLVWRDWIMLPRDQLDERCPKEIRSGE